MPSGSQVNLVPLWIVAILIWNSIENINFFPGEYKSWPSKVKLWSGRPGTLSSPSCSPSTTPSLRLLPSRMMLETNFVSGCLECCMRSGLLLVSSPFLDPLSGRLFRYGYLDIRCDVTLRNLKSKCRRQDITRRCVWTGVTGQGWSRNGTGNVWGVVEIIPVSHTWFAGLTWPSWLTNWSSCMEESCLQSSCQERTRSWFQSPWPESVWLKPVSGYRWVTALERHMFLQVFEQPGQPGGTEQTRQSVPDAAVLPVRHRVGQCDRPNPSSLPPLPAHHLL